MTTIEKLQQLSDGEFHSLCDDLFRRLESRYRRLRTHGLNPEGVSVKGQPDSYVGDTAGTCTIAFQYSIKKQGWWNKIIDDVRDAVKLSPGVQEIVIATPRDIDREGPQDKRVDWLGAAKEAAGPATLQLHDGRDIARLLDGDHQDLRHEHLHIPYSRLSGQSILASCQYANSQAISELEAQGRYDRARYSPRGADHRLFDLWQHALHVPYGGGSTRRRSARLIALVNDSGMGKTSLLARFVSSLGSAFPALILQARDLTLASEDSLVAHVVQAMQGVMDPTRRNSEEVAVVHHLSDESPLTVVVDGLDEAKNAESVRKVLNFWLKSRLGQMGVLVVSSRPEFWKMCVDRGWRALMPNEPLEDRGPTPSTLGWSLDRTDPTDGIRLPDRFTVEELEAAWVRAAQPRERLFALQQEAREELRHPFTLRVYLDLLKGGGPPRQMTRAALLRTWLNRRLEMEAQPTERLGHEQFQQALVTITNKLSEIGGGYLSVDSLSDVPRFDPARPPGPVVERLLYANILESVPGHPDRIRFVIESVHDFYWAEAQVAAIDRAPVQAAQLFTGLSFSEAYSKLAHVGQILVGKDTDTPQRYAESLATIDARKAAVLLRADPSRYDSRTRQKVVDELGRQVTARHRVCGALAIHLLGDLHCDESRACLEARTLPPAEPDPYLKMVAAEAFAKLDDVVGIELVYACPWFRYHSAGEAYYFKDTLAMMRSTTSEFRMALANYASVRLQAASGEEEHARAVSVLAYLGDSRLALHLNDRLTENGFLREYENHALLALGTDQAGRVFCHSARKAAENISKLGYEDGGAARYDLHSQVSSPTADHEYIYTPQFESHVVGLIRDDDQETAYLGYDLAMRSHRQSLIRHAIYAVARWRWRTIDWGKIGEDISPDSWLAWWHDSTDTPLRQRLVSYLPAIPNVEIEQILIGCLESPEYRITAVGKLGQLGCYRSAPYLRQLLGDTTGNVTLWEKTALVRSLGQLRDQASITSIRTVVLEHPKGDLAFFGIPSLGWIGGSDAEEALGGLWGTGADEQRIAGALVLCGSSSAVSRAIRLARSKPDGPKWLCESIHKALRIRGYRRGEYYTHIATETLASYLASVEYPANFKERQQLVEGVRQIDGPEIRAVLRKWASTSDSSSDPADDSGPRVGRAQPEYEELMLRGDEYAIPYCLDARSNERSEVYLYLTAENLNRFPSDAVAAELRRRLAAVGCDDSQAVRLLSLLGRFGNAQDESLIRPYLDAQDDLISNIACESLLRLTDPMLVPENWREM
jgi:hypothetical protein